MANPSNATVKTKPAIAYAGQDMTPDRPRLSFINEAATALDAGIPVARGTAVTSSPGGPEMCKVVAADGDELLGVTLRNVSKDADANQAPKYERWEDVLVAAEGTVAVIAAEAVRGGDEVIVIVAGAGAAATAFGSSKGGAIGSGRVALTGWKWDGNGDIAAETLTTISRTQGSRGRITT